MFISFLIYFYRDHWKRNKYCYVSILEDTNYNTREFETFKKYPNESEKKILDEILKELKKVKQPNIDFNKIIKDDSN